jgi:hypothetical protein
MSIASIVEGLAETKTVTIENQASQPGLTPGGLEPTNNVPTLGKMQAGSFTAKLVVAIEGCKFLLSDATSASVLSAWAGASGGDWTDVLGGLFVELNNSQSIRPDDPFPNSGNCVIRILDQDHSDTFGKFVHKRTSGSSSVITSTVDRNDTTINVGSTTGFASSGVAYIGAEAFSYTGLTATSFTGVTRGKYSPFACDSSGSGGSRFAGHHRVASDIYHVQQNPVVSEVPRVWINKRIGVWLHTWNQETQQLNTQKNAQCLFSGRVVGIADDAESMTTSLEVEQEGATFKNAVIFRDPWAATVAEGVSLIEGRTFQFFDGIEGSAGRQANDLVVVAGSPANTNQIAAGVYTADELCAAFNAWLAGELTAGRIYGHYSFASPVSSNDGLRTAVSWRIEGGANLVTGFTLMMPGEINAFLGLNSNGPGDLGVTAAFWSPPGVSNETATLHGGDVPFTTLVFKPFGAGRISQEFSGALYYEAENERGTFVGQYSLMPGSVKEACLSTEDWGFFLLDEKVLMVGSYDAGILTNCWVAPFQLTADNDVRSAGFIGRRADEAESGPITLRQVMILESVFSSLVNALAYSTGTAGYNHSTHDTLAHGLGAAIPGEQLGPEWERSLSNMPCANSPLVVVIDEPTKFADLLRDDLRLRRAFIRWKNEHFEFKQWRTPLVANAVATLEESNKAAPAGTQDSHRVASEESDQWHYPVVKVDYARDFAVGRSGQYLKSIQIEDQTATDDASGAGRSLTLKMRNTYGMFQNTGAAIEELVKEYIPGMPMFSRPSRTIARSIDLRYFETLGVGDIVVVTDEFARDPLTGARGVNARAGLITRLNYNLGGPTPQGSVRDMVGEVEIFFLDVQRGSEYAPAADVDWEWNLGGYSAGYLASSSSLFCKPHQYTRLIDLDTGRGKVTDTEPLDASYFVAGDKITIVERDPADPAAPITWNRTIASVSGNAIALTASLSAPAWDATKKYRIIYQPYTSVTATQADKAFQADDTDGMIQDTEIPYHFSIDEETGDFRRASFSDRAELVPTLAYGDGRAMDAGIDKAIAITANAYIDYKSAHQSITISGVTPSANLSGSGTSFWRVLYWTPIFVGTEHCSATITRSLTVAPRWRSSDGTNAWLRITISRQPPVSGPAVVGIGLAFLDPMFTGDFSQVQYGPITSTTYQIGADATLSLGVKDLQFGYAWLIIEGAGAAVCQDGLAKCLEGPRTTV